MVGLVEALLAAEGVDVGRDGVGELPADGRLGRERIVRDLDEGVAGRGRQVARDDLEGLGITTGRRIGAGGGLVPAQLEEARVERGRHHLEGALALDGDADGIGAADHIPDGAERVRGDGIVQREGDVAQGGTGAGAGRVIDGVDQGAAAEVRRVAHQEIPGGGLKIGRAGERDLRVAAGSGGLDLRNQADHDAIREAGVSRWSEAIAASVFRANQLGGVNWHGVRDSKRDLLDQALLEKAGGGRGLVGLAVLLNDLGRHHHDHRDGSEHEDGHRERGENFDQGERALAADGAVRRGAGDDGDHRKERATVIDWERGRPLIW